MMKYIVLNKTIKNINKFYNNVAKKYSHVYSKILMHKNINDAYNAIYQIENGLLRRQPTISRWKGMYMATSQDKRWNFAYRIEGDTIYVEDACHSQNMHESKVIIRLTESDLHNIVRMCVNEIIKKIA